MLQVLWRGGWGGKYEIHWTPWHLTKRSFHSANNQIYHSFSSLLRRIFLLFCIYFTILLFLIQISCQWHIWFFSNIKYYLIKGLRALNRNPDIEEQYFWPLINTWGICQFDRGTHEGMFGRTVKVNGYLAEATLKI